MAASPHPQDPRTSRRPPGRGESVRSACGSDGVGPRGHVEVIVEMSARYPEGLVEGVLAPTV